MDTDPPIEVSASHRQAKGRRERKRLLSISVIAAFTLGAVFVGVFNMALGWTNTEKFCISCHEMKDTVYREYQDSAHNINRTGVRPVCADCHVPKEFVPKMIRKVKASNEVFHKILGSISTPEKFEGKRAELAQREWKRLYANNSQECRNCHTPESFDLDLQSKRAREQHEEFLLTKQKTCIECHWGQISHNAPEGITQADVDRLLKGIQANSSKGDPPKADSSTDQEESTDSPGAAPE